VLTREQLLLAAEWVALATVAHEGKEAAEAAKLHGKHVKTAKGAAWYKQPIGSLIIAKPHPHKLEADQKIVYAGGHSWAVPKQADVYVPGFVDLNNDAEVELSDKWVNLDVEHGGKMVMLGQHDGPGTEGGQQISDP
jgi:predicted small secreted protein